MEFGRDRRPLPCQVLVARGPGGPSRPGAGCPGTGLPGPLRAGVRRQPRHCGTGAAWPGI